MAAEVENMFSVREVPWHGLGTIVKEAPTSADAIRLAGLDWSVYQDEVFTSDGIKIDDAYVNIRMSDNKPLGIVGSRYQIVQNRDAFSFTDALLGEGVKYETAGSLKGGKVIWLLARMDEPYKILGDDVVPWLCFTNSFDGSGAIKVAMVSTRVVCANTLNFALKTAKRTWSTRHVGDIDKKMDEAQKTLQLANTYMESLNNEFEELYKVKLNKDKVIKFVDRLVPVEDDAPIRTKNNVERIRNDILIRYENAPDLKDREQTGARLIQAVSDSVSHIQPLRMTKNYKENFFASMVAGNDLLDKAVNMIRVAA